MMDTNTVNALHRFAGRGEALQQEKRTLLHQLSENEQIVAYEKDVYDVLEELQDSMAKSSVGLYSELLTAIVRDVMGDQGTEIQLEPSMHGNRPALNVYGINNGEKEDIVESQGGSINNLLSAGFRFIALALSSERRFVVLDESDCWVSVDLVPRFIEVLDRLCSEMGVQAIFISHHTQSNELPIYKIELSPGTNGFCVDVHDERVESDADKQFNADMLEGIAIKQIRLTNYMSHVDTVLPLSAGLTTLVAPNNLGKSVVTRALSDLMTNNRLSSRIRHDQDVASVSLILEDHIELRWSLALTKSAKPKATYLIKDKQGNTLELEEAATEVPSFVFDHLQMTATGDTTDKHISHQKDPLFVLNPAISQYRRAEIIDLGAEYEAVAKAIKKHREVALETKRKIASAKSQLDKINSELQRLSGLSDAITLTECVRHWQQECADSEKQMDTIGELLMLDDEKRKLEANWALINSAESVVDGIDENYHEITAKMSLLSMHEEAAANLEVMANIEQLKRLAQDQKPQQAVNEIDRQLSILSGLSVSKVQQDKQAFDAAMHVINSANADAGITHKKLALLLAFFDCQTELEKEKSSKNTTEKEIARINNKLDLALKNANTECPLCHQPLQSAHSH